VLAVAAQNPNTIVVVHSVGPMILEPWIDHPNVTAVCTHCMTFVIRSDYSAFVRSFGQVFRAKKQGILSPTFCMAPGTRLEGFRIRLQNKYPTILFTS